MPDSRDTRTLGGSADQRVATSSTLMQPGVMLASRYRITAFLAQGGMGEVYAARDERLSEDIAVKVLRSGGLDSQGMKTLVDEVRVARRVTHQNVCRVYDLDTDGPLTFLTMELLAGETLEARLAREKVLEHDACVKVLEPLAAGLDAAHQAGVIHRDLKPSNVLLVGARVVITDFGIARFASARTTTGAATRGTPAYIAPEQLDGKKVTPAADLYAFGVVAFELLTGALPFEGKDATALGLARLTGKPRAANEVNPKVSAEVNDVLQRALSREPGKRFETAAQFVQTLANPPKPGLWKRLARAVQR